MFVFHETTSKKCCKFATLSIQYSRLLMNASRDKSAICWSNYLETLGLWPCQELFDFSLCTWSNNFETLICAYVGASAYDWIFTALDEVEKLQGDNRYHCDLCHQLADVERSVHYITAPRVLTLHLKRFAAQSRWFSLLTQPECWALRSKDCNCRFYADVWLMDLWYYCYPTNVSYRMKSKYFLVDVKSTVSNKLKLN